MSNIGTSAKADQLPYEIATPLGATVLPGASPRIPWSVVVALSLLFLAFWLSPPLDFLKRSDTIFPLTLHSMMESFSVLVALLVFTVSWHAYSEERPANVVVLACGFLAVGLLDFAHMLSYKGMPDFVTAASPQKAIDFWLAARYTAALTLLTVAMRAWVPLKKPQTRYVLLACALAVAGAVYILELYFPQVWPATFVDGYGLTTFKIGAEYGIVMVLMAAAICFYDKAYRHPSFDAVNLFTATLITILSELCFTLYSNVNDVFQLVGHAYKVVSYFFIYRAVFITSVREPYQQLHAAMMKRREAEERIEFLAYHDPLTELPNRLLIRDRLEKSIAHAKRRGTRVALLFCDLDNFKFINDTLGHVVGDALLREVSERLVSMIRSCDTVSRLGGDEFLIILDDLADGQDAVPVLLKLLERMQQPLSIDDHDLSVSVSVGIALYPEDGTDFDTLLQKADTAMYRAKAAGRNTYRFFDQEMNKDSFERLKVRSGLRQAIERNEFVLHYQPQVDLTTNRIFGAEALLRWQSPEMGLMAPGRFISVAEESGLIVPIGAWVIKEACRQVAAWRKTGLPELTVAVNLSALQFLQGDLEKTVKDALEASGLEPHCLELELTESILIQDTEAILATVKRLAALGVQLSIDDFGTGYSSMSYLKRFSVDKLKIDQSFVRDLATDPDDAAIVRAIIQMAQSMGLKTIAEGVETEEILQLLRGLHCDEAQGYHFARPLPAADFVIHVTQKLGQSNDLAGGK
jgi:diguanylate cyclase (GGDEF)-like protein